MVDWHVEEIFFDLWVDISRVPPSQGIVGDETSLIRAPGGLLCQYFDYGPRNFSLSCQRPSIHPFTSAVTNSMHESVMLRLDIDPKIPHQS